MKVLHVAAEMYPLVKTGGLADVVAALPVALAEQGLDVRLLLPGYPAVLEGLTALRPVVDVGPCFGAVRVRVLRGRCAGSSVPVYAIDAPYLYGRAGNPYLDGRGEEWGDNLQRFALLGFVAAHLAAGDIDPEWVPAALHAHDWHAAMACAYVAEHPPTTAATVFTVHNLAFQGLFPMHDWPALGLATRLMSPAGLEFHGRLSFMKAGLKFADHVTTVSPTYAREIATHDFGCGLDGVVRSRGGSVGGILNGIDDTVWNPATDPSIERHYDIGHLQGKQDCRRALQHALGWPVDDSTLLLTIVSRLTAQKGIDLVLAALPALVGLGVQVAVQGTGDAPLEEGWRQAQRLYPGRVHTHIGYDEARAHRLIAGADAILLPSRFEPCGLTQLYGLRYGTLPIVRRVGGLADTVGEPGAPAALPAVLVPAVPGRPAPDAAPAGPPANGFVFDEATPQALEHAVARALALRADPAAWQRRMAAGMSQDLSWNGPAAQYARLYRQLVASRASAGSRSVPG